MDGGSKNSKSIALGAVAVITVVVGAYACSASGEEETAHCVTTGESDSGAYDDSSTDYGSYEVVDDYNCDDDDDYNRSYSSSHGTYFWYYGGQVSSGRISGGTTTRPSGATISTDSGRTIQRGGFGGSFGGGS